MSKWLVVLVVLLAVGIQSHRVHNRLDTVKRLAATKGCDVHWSLREDSARDTYVVCGTDELSVSQFVKLYNK